MDDVTLFDLAIGLIVLVLGGGLFSMWVIGTLNSNPDEEDSGKSVLNFGTAALRYNITVRSKAGGDWIPVHSNVEKESLAWTLAEDVKAKEGRSVKITDSKGNLVGTL